MNDSIAFKLITLPVELNGVQYAAKAKSPVVSVLECSSVVSIDRNLT